jgi:hypothetical protein
MLPVQTIKMRLNTVLVEFFAQGRTTRSFSTNETTLRSSGTDGSMPVAVLTGVRDLSGSPLGELPSPAREHSLPVEAR